MENYKTVDSLIAEISGSGEFFKDNPTLLDKPTIYRWVFLALKKFGLNIMQKEGKIIPIENYRGLLPSNFGKLSLAVFCECDKVVVPEDKKERLLSTYFYKDTLQTKFIIESTQNKENSCETEKCEESETHIVEKFFLGENDCGDISLYYKNPAYVRLGRDVLYDACIDDCVNRNMRDCKYSINIKSNIVYANFRNGNLYCEFYATPMDEETGAPIIPDSDRGSVEQYLEAMIKRKVLFEAQLAGDKNNIQYLYNDLRLEEQQLLREAQQDVSPMSLKHFWKLIEHRRRENSRFDIYLK